MKNHVDEAQPVPNDEWETKLYMCPSCFELLDREGTCPTCKRVFKVRANSHK